MILIKHLYKNLLYNMRKIVRRFLFSDERNNKITKGSNSKNINDTKSEDERKKVQ